MNTKNNKRRRQSVEQIEKAFVEALQVKELSQISVSAICKAAEINRSTFYANFEDIYALADQVKAHLEDEVNQLYVLEVTQKFNSNDYLRLFRHIQENQLFYRTFFKLGYENNDSIRLYDVHQAEYHFNNKHIDYHIAFFQSGLNAIIKKWLDGGCQEPAEEMDEIIRSEYHGRCP